MGTNIYAGFFFGIVKELRSYAQQARKQSHKPTFLAQFFWKLCTYEHYKFFTVEYRLYEIFIFQVRSFTALARKVGQDL